MPGKLLALCGVLCTLISANTLHAQPALERVERLMRAQVDQAAGVTSRPSSESSEPGYLGLVADDRPQAGRGVTVISVVAGGAAAKAGLLRGDLILTIGGNTVRTTDDMAQAIEGKPPGAALVLTVERGGVEREVTVTLRRRARPPAVAPSPAAGQRLGVRTLAVSDEARRQNNLPDAEGAMVVSVVPGSQADRAGIPLGAVIRSIGDTVVRSPEELAAAVRAARAGDVELAYVYQGTAVRATVVLAVASPTDEAKLELLARPIDSAPAAQSRGDAQASAGALARIAALEERVRALEGRVEELAAKLSQRGDARPPADAKEPE